MTTLAEVERLARAAISDENQHTKETDDLLVAIRALFSDRHSFWRTATQEIAELRAERGPLISSLEENIRLRARLEFTERLVLSYEEYVAAHIEAGDKATARLANALTAIKDYSPALQALQK